jgi:hypothetical protein
MSPPAEREAVVDFRRQPRRRRPSERNFAIHQAYRAGLRTQGQLAAEFGLPQSCISRIVRQVDRWLAAGAHQAGRDCGEQARIEWQLEVARLNAVFNTAIRYADQQPREVRSTRIRQTSRGERREEIRQEIAPDARWLRVALDAAEQLDRLMRDPPQAAQSPELGHHSQPPTNANQAPSKWSNRYAPLADEACATALFEAALQVAAPPEVEA